MPEYEIKKPCRPDGNLLRDSGTVKLTEHQAKYLLLNGSIEPKTKKAQAKK